MFSPLSVCLTSAGYIEEQLTDFDKTFFLVEKFFRLKGRSGYGSADKIVFYFI